MGHPNQDHILFLITPVIEHLLSVFLSLNTPLQRCRLNHPTLNRRNWEKDGITEDEIDGFVIRLGEDDDDSSSSHSSVDPSDPESDEELVVPLLMGTENKMSSK
ncbi:hypothetical protein J6590_078274 [Homalodisca vitripennis]|nr:hypothetical protein J6590_078274 [Homalodisca vitripennis]